MALEGYGGRPDRGERWAWRLRITIPRFPGILCPPLKAWAVGVLDGDVLVVQNTGLVMPCDMDGEMMVSTLDLRTADIFSVWRQGLYRESLVPLRPPRRRCNPAEI